MRLSLFSWALYDLANTTFSLNVVSRYLPLLVVQDLGGRDIEVSAAYSSSMVIVALGSPFLGAWSDQRGNRLPFLVIFTAGTILLTALMGVADGKLLLLLLFASANFFYQGALVFYDALLPAIATEEERGWASGLGVALGYVGAIGSLYLVAPFAERGGGQAAFLPTAALFLLFAAPCFVFVRERREAASRIGEGRRGWILAGVQEVRDTLHRLRDYPCVVRFLLSRFLYTDAINTVILFMGVFAVALGGFESREVTALFALSTLCAVVGALAQGFLVDRFGAGRPLIGALLLWVATLLLAAGFGGPVVMWVVGPMAGVGLGATWTADRVMLLKLAPAERLGQFYGFYGMVGRFAAVFGPLVWGVLVWAFEGWGQLAYRVAAGALVLMVTSGLTVFYPVLRDGCGGDGSGRASS